MGEETTVQAPLVAFEPIEGVYTVPIRLYADDRGAFSEIFRKEWFPMVNWGETQVNRSVSKAGVLRGLHYHLNQVDYWYLMAGQIRVGLADLRSASPTYKTGATLVLDANEPTGLFIPVGVAHGFYALTDCVLTYIVNQYYGGGQDERGVRWDDPDLGVDWQTDAPVLSGRDQKNPLLTDIPADEQPE